MSITYKICPVCGNKLQLVNGSYICTNENCNILIIGNSILDLRDIHNLITSNECTEEEHIQTKDNKKDIVVMNKTAVEEYSLSEQNVNSVIISITSKKSSEAFITKNKISKVIDLLKIQFNDTDIEDKYFGGITYEEAKLIADFVKTYKDNENIQRIIVQCEAGQSRSAGVAAAIMKYLYDDDTPIFNNKRYTPNMLCYKKVLTALMYGE